MSWFDAASLALVLLAVLDGATSGLAWAALECCALAGAAVAAKAAAPAAEPYVFKIAALPPDELPWVTHLTVFGFSACFAFGVLLLVHPRTKAWRFPRDRWFGGALGAVNGAAAAVLVAAMLAPVRDPRWEAEARSSRVLGVTAAVAEGPLRVLLPAHAGPRTAELRGE